MCFFLLKCFFYVGIKIVLPTNNRQFLQAIHATGLRVGEAFGEFVSEKDFQEIGDDLRATLKLLNGAQNSNELRMFIVGALSAIGQKPE
jgi:hypothetical protein